jgi:hypothetical protein
MDESTDDGQAIYAPGHRTRSDRLAPKGMRPIYLRWLHEALAPLGGHLEHILSLEGED